MIRRPPRSTRTDTLFPYTTLFRSHGLRDCLYSYAVRVLRSNTHRRRDQRRYLSSGGSNHERINQQTQTTTCDVHHVVRDHDGAWLPWRCLEARSEERRVGKGCVSTCRSRRSTAS